MSQSHLPNPFHSAIRVNGITVWLKPDDLLSIRPGITPRDADKLLERHGSAIAARMISAGIEAATHILEAGENDARARNLTFSTLILKRQSRRHRRPTALRFEMRPARTGWSARSTMRAPIAVV